MTSRLTNTKAAEVSPTAVFARLRVLKKRSEFISASKARYQTAPGLTVQVRNRRDDDPMVGIGFTCSKKVGNAVARNRAKRRLREIARLDLSKLAKPGHDYVLIGKRDVTANRSFDDLRADLAKALAKLS